MQKLEIGVRALKGDKSCNAGYRRPPIRSDRWGPQGKTRAWGISKEIRAVLLGTAKENQQLVSMNEPLRSINGTKMEL